MKLKTTLAVLIFLVIGVGIGRLISPSKEDSSTENTEFTSKRSTGWAAPREVSSAKASSGRSSHRFRAMMDKWGKGQLPNDWNAELKKIFELPEEEGFDREKALFLFFAKWAETDFDEAIKMAGKTGKIAQKIKKELFVQYAAKDPHAALAYYEKNKDACDKYDYYLKEIARNWGIKSPEEAFVWCCSFEERKKTGVVKFSRYQAFISFMDGVIQSNDFDLITTYMEKIRSENGNIPNSVIANWAGVNSEQAMNWIVSHLGDENNLYICNAIEGMTNTNFKMAEELLADLSHNQRVYMVGNMARKIQYSQGEEAALNWAMKQMPLSDFNGLTYTPLSNWGTYNPLAATQWVQNLPASSSKDAAIDSCVKGVLSRESNADGYGMAMELVKSMEDANKKENMIKSVIDNWRKNDPVGYEKWEKESKKVH